MVESSASELAKYTLYSNLTPLGDTELIYHLEFNGPSSVSVLLVYTVGASSEWG